MHPGEAARRDAAPSGPDRERRRARTRSTSRGRGYARSSARPAGRDSCLARRARYPPDVPPPLPAGTAIRRAYEAGETDEFVKPRVIAGTPRIRSGDGIFCFNYRADRMRQVVRALAMDGFDGFDTGVRPTVDLVTMTQYDETFPFPMAFGPMVLSEIVAQVLSDQGKTMFRTAETEEYAHVTYFFHGGVETPYPGEERLLVPSQKVATYDLMPEMSAPGVTDVLCKAIEAGHHDFILCNYANGDMVGHSGVLSAAVQAV